MSPIVRSSRIRATLLLGAACALASACSGGLDQGAVPCRNDGECPSGAFCTAAGKCAAAPSCAPSTKLCHGQCIDVQTDVANCGVCGQVCQAPANGGATCAAGACGFTCTSPAVRVADGCMLLPATPTGVQIATGATILVSWIAGADAKSWIVLTGTSATGPFQSNPVSTNSFTDSNASPGVTYFYEIVAVNQAGRSGASAAVSGARLALPAAPVNVRATPSANILVTWDAGSDATSWIVKRSPTGSGQAQVAVSTNSFTDTAVAPGATESYQILAVNAAGTGPASATVTATTAPAAPSGLASTAVSAASASFTWNRVAGATSYSLLRSATAGTETTAVATANDPGAGTTASATDSTVQASTSYFYVVIAANNGGALTSGNSNEVSIATPTPPPANVVATATDDTHITLTWSPAASATSYDIVRGTASGTEVPLTSVGALAQPSYVDSRLTTDTTYFYKVITRHNSLSSAPSSEATARTLLVAPTNLTASAPTDGTVTLTFAKPSGGPFSYELFRGFALGQELSATPPPNTIADSGTPGQQSYVDSPLAPATAYYYKIRTRNAAGNVSAPSNGATATTTNVNAPSGLGLNAVDDTHVQITLNHMTGLDLYEFYRSNSSTAPTSATTPTLPAITQAAGQIAFTDTLPAAGTPPTWYYSVRARYSGDATVTPWSAPLAVQFATAVPATPSGSVAAAGGNVALVSWSVSNPASTTYTLTRDTSPTGTFSTTVATNLINPFFTDATVKNGATYYYRVVATNPRGSTQSAVFPSSGAPVDPNAFVATRAISYFSDTPDVVVPIGGTGNKTLAVIVPQTTGAPVTTVMTCSADGYCVATGIPQAGGVYVRASGYLYVFTNARTIDLGRESLGRVSSSPGFSTLTPLSITLSNLAPFTSTDRLELSCSNAGAGSEDLQTSALANAPSVGATQLNQFTVDLNVVGNGKGIDTNAGDRPFLTQQTAATSSTGVPYVRLAGIYSLSNFSPVDGRANSVGGGGAGFSPVSSSTAASIFYARSQFKALTTQVNPNASLVGAQDALVIQAVPVGAGPVSHPIVGYPAGDILNITFDAGTSDVNVGNVSFGNPFPSTWPASLELFTQTNVSVSVPGLKPYVDNAGYGQWDVLANALAQASSPSGLTPVVGPPSSPQIRYVDSANAQRTVSAFIETTGVGLTPTFSWSPPTSGMKVPTYYRIFLNQIGDTGDGSGVAGLIGFWQFYTLGTSFTIPPGILVAGSSYFAEIRAAYEPGRDPTMTPFSHRSSTLAFIPAVTARFVP